MANPSFNGFSLQDSNWITERVTFKGYATRGVIRATINRREGVKLLATEFGEKQVLIEGRVVANSATQLQTLMDNLKSALTAEEGSLVIEDNRTFKGTVLDLTIPDEHYSLTTAPYSITFLCSNPFAEGTQLTAIIPVQSGTFTFSGTVNISGTLFGRPIVTYIPPNLNGHTLIRQLLFFHTPTGQSVTISGLGSGTDLNYQNSVSVNYDTFSSFEGVNAIQNSGAFSRWQPGNNAFTLTASGRGFPGGTVQITYSPRWL